MATIKNGQFVRVLPKTGFDCNTKYFYAARLVIGCAGGVPGGAWR